jgi:hypothetical protein
MTTGFRDTRFFSEPSKETRHTHSALKCDMIYLQSLGSIKCNVKQHDNLASEVLALELNFRNPEHVFPLRESVLRWQAFDMIPVTR